MVAISWLPRGTAFASSRALESCAGRLRDDCAPQRPVRLDSTRLLRAASALVLVDRCESEARARIAITSRVNSNYLHASGSSFQKC